MTEIAQSTLTDFLLARIAEDEELARRPFGAEPTWISAKAEPDAAPGAQWFRPGAVWDPARVLAECEAKRRIVELHSGGHECSQYDHNGDVDNCTYAHDFDNCSTMCLLALPYADHPDYRNEWRP